MQPPVPQLKACSNITTVLPRLYLLTDRQNTAQRPLASLIDQAVKAGLRMVQIREKDLATRPLMDLGQELMPLITQQQGIVLVNDRIDLALALHADGVHLRMDSLPLPLARRLLGTEKLIGISTHSVDEVRYAEQEGADFVVLGPIFETPSKRIYGPPLGLRTLETACKASRLPLFAIGGMTPPKISSVLSSGAYGIAVISAILQAPNIENRIKDFLAQLP